LFVFLLPMHQRLAEFERLPLLLYPVLYQLQFITLWIFLYRNTTFSINIWIFVLWDVLVIVDQDSLISVGIWSIWSKFKLTWSFFSLVNKWSKRLFLLLSIICLLRAVYLILTFILMELSVDHFYFWC